MRLNHENNDLTVSLRREALVGQEAMEKIMQQALRIATDSIPDQGK